MTTSFILSDRFISKTRENLLLLGIAITGSSMAFAEWSLDSSIHLNISHIGCILILQGAVLHMLKPNGSTRKWLSIITLAVMSLLCIVLAATQQANYFIAIPAFCFNVYLIKRLLR